MRFRSAGTGVLLLLAACGSEEGFFAGSQEASVVYGNDDRTDVFAHPDADLRRLANESVAVLIPRARLNATPAGTYALEAPTLGSREGLCADENFIEQPAAAVCSGVLIAEDLLLTAGHCVEPSVPGDFYSYVFNYQWEEDGTLAPITESDVYFLNRVVLDADPTGGRTPDFAVLQLDRPVTSDRRPPPVRAATPLEVGDSLAMIGSATGIPIKIDDGGWVADRPEGADYYVTNLDAFGAHSGSPTFDDDNRLAGILIGGRPDYVFDQASGCYRVNTLDESLAGELVHDISPIIYELCAIGEGGDELCEEDACDGESCGAPPTEKSPTDPPDTVGAVPASSGGCSVSGASHAPLASISLLLLWCVATRSRRKAA